MCSDTRQPKWKLVYATDYSALYVDETGVYDPQLQIAQENGDHDEDDLASVAAYVYRFDLDRCKVSDPNGEMRAVADDAIESGDLASAAVIEASIRMLPTFHLIPYAYNFTWNANGFPCDRDEWFFDSLGEIARTVGSTRDDLIDALCSEDPATRAEAYEAIGDHHGYDNLDSYPEEWSEHEFKEWPERGVKLDETEREAFRNGYIECALWAGVLDYKHEDECPLDADPDKSRAECTCDEPEMVKGEGNYDEGDLNAEALASLTSDAHDFYEAHVADLRASTLDMSQLGHDFWLTRNGHGAGFWDHGHISDEADPALARLTDASKPYGEQSLIVADDGKIELL
jgi:hypothetical protein